jgi:hypothetical protein
VITALVLLSLLCFTHAENVLGELPVSVLVNAICWAAEPVNAMPPPSCAATCWLEPRLLAEPFDFPVESTTLVVSSVSSRCQTPMNDDLNTPLGLGAVAIARSPYST